MSGLFSYDGDDTGPPRRGHNYHPQCGCYSCGLIEEAAELAEEADGSVDEDQDDDSDTPDDAPVAKRRAPASVCVVLGVLLAPALCLSWVHSVWWLVTWGMAVALVLLWEAIGGH